MVGTIGPFKRGKIRRVSYIERVLNMSQIISYKRHISFEIS